MEYFTYAVMSLLLKLYVMHFIIVSMYLKLFAAHLLHIKLF